MSSGSNTLRIAFSRASIRTSVVESRTPALIRMSRVDRSEYPETALLMNFSNCLMNVSMHSQYTSKPLPPEQAAPLWQTAQAQAMKALEAAAPSRALSAILFVRSYRKSCKADNCRDEHRQDVGQHWVAP
jgi:hypothetical protein